MDRYATEKDFEGCRAIHRQFGRTFYFATARLKSRVRNRIHAIYAFVRIPDEWVDNGFDLELEERWRRLNAWREQFVAGLAGKRPDHFAMRAFCDVVQERRIPPAEAHAFLDAMAADLAHTRFQTFDELVPYMRGCASSVGVMMAYAVGLDLDDDTMERARTLGVAIQVTNILRDIAEDWERGRLYLPLEDMARFGVDENDIAERRLSPAVIELLKFEIERARELYREADIGIRRLPSGAMRPALLARILYARILDRIEAQQYDVFTRRARTNFFEKLRCAGAVALWPNRLFARLDSLPPGQE